MNTGERRLSLALIHVGSLQLLPRVHPQLPGGVVSPLFGDSSVGIRRRRKLERLGQGSVLQSSRLFSVLHCSRVFPDLLSPLDVSKVRKSI